MRRAQSAIYVSGAPGAWMPRKPILTWLRQPEAFRLLLRRGESRVLGQQFAFHHVALSDRSGNERLCVPVVGKTPVAAEDKKGEQIVPKATSNIAKELLQSRRGSAGSSMGSPTYY